MITQLTATVVGGMLKPDEALQLAEQTRVKLTLEPIVEKRDPVEAWESLKARLRERPIDSLGEHYTRDELHERR